MEPGKLTDFAITLSERDNVATALRDIPAGAYACAAAAAVAVPRTIRAGFKLALRPIAPGEKILKYGHVIGLATHAIAPGDLVHVHNMRSSVQ